MILSALLVLILPTNHRSGPGGDAGQIRLSPSMLINESGFGDPGPLVDEQDADKEHPPTNPYFPGWTAWEYPISVVIDLGGRCRIDHISLYNPGGDNRFQFATGTPAAWRTRDVNLTGYKSWTDFSVDGDTRWLRVTLLKPTSLPELQVYGTRLEPELAPPKPKRRRALPTMDEFVGVNAFIDDPIDKIAPPSGIVREYHPIGWDFEGSDGLRRFQPSGAAGGNLWFFDDYYAKLKAAGATVCPVVWEAPERFFHTKSREAKPISPDANSEDPASYRFHAEHLFQYAARYGHRKVADSLLSLAPGQPRVSGLGTLSYIENWNEPDKAWEGRESRFNPYDLAALSSADYDGDQGRMGKTVGVKNADPSMHLVLGGLTALDLPFLKAIKLWSDTHRNGSFPADAINLHHYSSSSNEQWFKPNGKGISPEDDHLREKLLAIADWRDAAIPERELWVTEFGYDTDPRSPLHVPLIGSMNAEQVQGAWLVREFMALAAARVDRATMFMLRDTNTKGAGVFETCGVVTEKGKEDPKTGWYYMVTLRRRLKGYRFERVVTRESDPVWLYEFVRADGHRAVVAWCPTSEDKHVSGFRLPVTGPGATLVTLANKREDGNETSLVAKDSAVSFDVSETPEIVLLR
jgi:hypothetical protein